MRSTKGAFTLIEILISITLLSLVLMALYKSSDLLQRSNQHLYAYLQDIDAAVRGSQMLYLDLLQSDGNLTITHKEKAFDRLTIQKTTHSLYGAEEVKVMWVVYKEKKTLLRIEGREYQLPLKERQGVEINSIAENLKFFKLYRGKKPENLLVVFQQVGQETQSFLVQGLTPMPFVPKMVKPSSFGGRGKPKVKKQ